MPFLDLAAAHRELADELEAAYQRVVGRGWFVLGEEVEAFEEEFARYVGARHCVGVGNGLDALTLALIAAGIGPGDEVIVPGMTFIATWLAVSRTGATPVPVDPDPETCCIDASSLQGALSERTRAIIPVHLYGRPAPVDEIREAVGAREVLVLEDAAQAHGARLKSRRVGSLGHAAAWSFYPAKNLGALGDGGAVTTDDDALAARVRLLRNYGSGKRYEHTVQGVNSRLDELQAALLRVKLAHLDEWNDRRRRVAGTYLSRLRDAKVTLPIVSDELEPVWHLFVVRTPRRDDLAAHLRASGVETQIHYPVPPHQQPAYAGESVASASLPITERLHREVLSLPIGPHLSPEHVDVVIGAVCSWFGSGA